MPETAKEITDAIGTSTMVGLDELAALVGYSEGAGAPTGNATRIGKWFRDTTNNDWYVAISTGSGAADWVQLASGVSRIASGTITPTTGTETVVTGLATVLRAVAGFQSAPTLTHMFVEADVGDQAGTPAAGSILIRSKKPTAAANVTPIAATTPWSAIDWVAVGT
jgi:hypothetical protein